MTAEGNSAPGRRNWLETVRLLDSTNSEPSKSSILTLFEPYTQRGTDIEQEIEPEWLDLAFANTKKIEEVGGSGERN